MDNLKSRIDLDQIANSPVARGVAFFFALGALVKVDLDFGRMIFDQDSIYPFLLLVLVPASLGLKIGWQAISVVRRCCIPIGVIVCLVNALAMLANMDSQQGFLLAQRLVYAPLAFGIFLSFLLNLVEPEIANKYELSFFEICGLFFFSIGAVTLAILSTSYKIDGFRNFWDLRAIGLCAVIAQVCLVYPDFKNHTTIEKLHRTSLAAVLVFATYGVAMYMYGITSDSVDGLVSGVATSILGILYGSVFSLFTISAGGQSSQTNEQKMFFDWHMIELYAFFMLIVLPPLSFNDLMGFGVN